MGRSDRDTRRRFSAIVVHTLLSVAALIVSVLGPFMVECRARNGTVAAKFLFSDCSTEAGCCNLPEDATPQPVAGCEADCSAIGCADGLCGGCSESDLFLFVGNRGARDDGQPIGTIRYIVAEAHPAIRLSAEPADCHLVETPPQESPFPPQGIDQILRI